MLYGKVLRRSHFCCKKKKIELHSIDVYWRKKLVVYNEEGVHSVLLERQV